MASNLGTADRVIRISVAIVVVAFYFTGVIQGTTGIILLALAAILALTGTRAFCPLYALFHYSTRAEKK